MLEMGFLQDNSSFFESMFPIALIFRMPEVSFEVFLAGHHSLRAISGEHEVSQTSTYQYRTESV
jgi:hypothetical protein